MTALPHIDNVPNSNDSFVGGCEIIFQGTGLECIVQAVFFLSGDDVAYTRASAYPFGIDSEVRVVCPMDLPHPMRFDVVLEQPDTIRSNSYTIIVANK
ncbi:hypothetical protein [Streptomyces sp. NPDC015350]|uniref:hypothetical protein n=1 Tax=Streptomyces sp. NPDC015350 TaxID=3364955 RepID=UPI0036F89721